MHNPRVFAVGFFTYPVICVLAILLVIFFGR